LLFGILQDDLGLVWQLLLRLGRLCEGCGNEHQTDAEGKDGKSVIHGSLQIFATAAASASHANATGHFAVSGLVRKT
jgi:hypothetical protein